MNFILLIAIGIITSSIVIGLIILLIVLSYQGLFASVNISEKNVGPYLLVYKKIIGDNKKGAPVMDKLYWDLVDNFAIETTKGFGLYYDNPKEVDKDKLRSVVGCIVEGKSIDDLKKVSEKYGVKEYPLSKSVVAQFPFKGKLSIMMGVFKVYPKFIKYIEEKKYSKTPIMELYDQPNEIIEYISSVNLTGDNFNDFLESDK